MRFTGAPSCGSALGSGRTYTALAVASAWRRANAPERRGMVGIGKAPGGLTVVVASAHAGVDPQRACRIVAVYIGNRAKRGSTETMRFGLVARPSSKARSARKR